jgi:hypothetical protein
MSRIVNIASDQQETYYPYSINFLVAGLGSNFVQCEFGGIGFHLLAAKPN